MFDLPKACLVSRVIPKNTFYKKVAISTALKRDFVDKVEKITWKYKLAENTLGSPKTEDVEEIQVFEIVLKEKIIPKNVLEVITKNIPYKILFILRHEDDYCYGIKVEKFYFTEWNETIVIKFNGLNLGTIYENIVKSIIREEDNKEDFDKVIEDKEHIEALKKQISVLEGKVKREKQFNRKVPLNSELNRLKKELEEKQNG